MHVSKDLWVVSTPILSLYTYLTTPFSDTQIGKLIMTWL